MFKKVTAIILIATLSLSIFAGCQSGNNGDSTGSAETGEVNASADLDHVTLRLYFPGEKKPDTDMVWEQVEELTKDRLNASFEVNFVPWNDYNDKISLLISSGDDYDYNFDGTWLMYPNMVNKGAYLDLKELAPEYMPNYYASLEERGFLEPAIVDGKMYTVPWTPVYNMKPFMTFNEDDLGMTYDEEIHTMEDLDAFLQAAHGQFPDKYYVINTDAPLTQTGWMLYGKYQLAKWDFHSLTFSLDNDGKVELLPLEETEMFREIAQWNTKWVDDGIIPADALMNRDKYYNMSKEFKLGQLSTMEYIYYDNRTADEAFKFYEMYPGQKYLARSPLDNLSCINVNAANPERMLMFLDILATDQEVYDAVIYGIEGTTYVIQEDGSLEYPEGIDVDTSNYMDWSGQWGLWRDYYLKPSGARNAEHYEVNNEFASREEFVVSPLAGFFADTEPIKNEMARRDAIFQEFALPILYGLVDDYDAAIDEYIEKQKEAGADVILEELQRQVDAYLGQ